MNPERKKLRKDLVDEDGLNLEIFHKYLDVVSNDIYEAVGPFTKVEIPFIAGMLYHYADDMLEGQEQVLREVAEALRVIPFGSTKIILPVKLKNKGEDKNE